MKIIITLEDIVDAANKLLKPEFQWHKDDASLQSIDDEIIKNSNIFGESYVELSSFKTLNNETIYIETDKNLNLRY